jgi:hypothetical protein
MYRDRWIDADVLAEVIHGLPGPRFAARHGVPLWVGEFGAVFAGPPEETDDRLRALDDQIAVFESAGWSWTAWTLKDIGAMGVLSIQPDSSYAALSEIAASLKSACLADKWATWEPQGPVAASVGALASALSSVGVAPFEQLVDELGGRVGSDYAADLLQEQFVAELGRLDDDALEQAAASFAFDVCCVRKPYADLLAERFAAGRRDG